MNEQVGNNIHVITTVIDKVLSDMVRGFAYGIWKFLYFIDNSIFSSFGKLLKDNPLKSALGQDLYNLFFAIGIIILILCSGFAIIINIVSNRPVENKNVVWQLIISIAILMATPTLIKEMSSITLNTSSSVVKGMDNVDNEKMYRAYFFDNELSVKENKVVEIKKDVELDKIMINTIASKDIIKEKPKELVKNPDKTYTWKTEKIDNGKIGFGFGLMDTYKYSVNWLDLFLVTILSVGVTFILLVKVGAKTLSCTFRSYLAPLWQSISSGHLRAVEFLGDWKDDMLFIFLSIMSVYFFRTATVEILKINDWILKYCLLIALAVVIINLANSIVSKISGGSFKDEGSSMAGMVAGGMVGGAISKSSKPAINTAKKGGKALGKYAGGKAVSGAKTMSSSAKKGISGAINSIDSRKDNKATDNQMGQLQNQKSRPKQALGKEMMKNSQNKKGSTSINGLNKQGGTGNIKETSKNSVNTPSYNKETKTNSVAQPKNSNTPEMSLKRGFDDKPKNSEFNEVKKGDKK